MRAEAKQQSCDAGALGAAVGEVIGDYYINDGFSLMSKKEINAIAQLTAGAVALLSGEDVNTAAGSALFSLKNNAYVGEHVFTTKKEINVLHKWLLF